MALVRTNLAKIAHTGVGSLYFLTSIDTAVAVGTVDYFLPVIDMLNVGDVIFALVDTDGTPGYGIFVVNSNTGTAIDVANMVDLAAADTA
jgi:hypothetical protein